ncbi:MAG: hypothetical protein KGL78_07990 [Burkholderiales bacterium]|nr:hypothetical protein [Burkholderiales bacterium]
MEPPTAPLIDSRAGFVAALHWGFAQAVARGARRIVCVDPDFADWPLGDPALLEALTQWLRRPQRQWLLLAATFDEVPRRHPRFVSWRRHWAHAVDAWRAPEDLSASLPTLLLDDGPLLVRLVDRAHWRGRAALGARESRPFRDEIDAVLQRSTQTLPATQLGL